MRNPALHDALRDFALETAAVLTEELRGGAEIEFDVVDEGDQRGPALYRYRPRTAEFVAARWEDLRALPTCARAGAQLGTGAALWLRVNGMAGERAEPALRAMLERLYEDATSFGFPEERFERLYLEVEQTLYQDAVQTRVLAPLHGVRIEPESVDLGGGLSLMRGDCVELPPDAAAADGGELPATVLMLERDATPDDPLRAADANIRFKRVVTAMRLFGAGAVSVAPVGWWRAGDARWTAVALASDGAARGADWLLGAAEADELRDLVRLCEGETSDGVTAWALARFEMGCSQPSNADALSDYLLALRALLDATTDAGQASLALRVAALCAEEGQRREVRRRVELTVSLERFIMSGGGHLDEAIRTAGPDALVEELEAHLRALLRDILCGYLERDLKSVADDILLESREPFEFQARDVRRAEESASRVESRAAETVEEPPMAWNGEQPAVRDPEPARRDGERAPVRESEPVQTWLDETPDADTAEVPALIAEPAHDEPFRVHRSVDRPAEPAPVVAVEPVQQTLDGVTPSSDWGFADPEDFSAPI